jgi:hypothetical protein
MVANAVSLGEMIAEARMSPVRLLAVLMLVAFNCAAAPFGVQVGEARIALDAPPGFSDTGFTGSPRLQELAESVTSASNRILSFAISDADLRRFTQGDTPDFRRYMTVVTPRGMEHERVGAAAFKAYAGDSLADLGPAAPAGDFLKFLDDQPHGKASLLAELRREPEVVSVLQGTRLPGPERASVFSRERPRYAISTTTLMLVRGKALNLSVYSLYEDAEDVRWIRVTTARWVDEVLRLNGR